MLFLNSKPPIMKTLVTLLFALIVAPHLSAQFNSTSVGSIPGIANVNNSLYIAYVDHDDAKYVRYDRETYIITMYNMDLTLFRQFTFPEAYQSAYP